MDVTIMWVRKSTLMAYLKCPRKAYYMAIHPEDVGSIEAQVGRMFHEYAYSFFDWVDVRELHDNDKYSPIPQDTPIIVQRLCKAFLEFERKRLRKIVETYGWDAVELFWKPVMREVEVKCPEYQMLGHIDRIDRTENGNYVIVEYKTSHRMNKSSLRFELSYYVMLCACAEPLPRVPSYIACYNPRLDEFFVEEVRMNVLRRVAAAVYKFTHSTSIEDFPRKPSHLCGYCPYVEICGLQTDGA